MTISGLISFKMRSSNLNQFQGAFLHCMSRTAVKHRHHLQTKSLLYASTTVIPARVYRSNVVYNHLSVGVMQVSSLISISRKSTLPLPNRTLQTPQQNIAPMGLIRENPSSIYHTVHPSDIFYQSLPFCFLMHYNASVFKYHVSSCIVAIQFV